MNKQLQSTETNRLPVRLRLPQISPQELKMIRIAIRRKDLPHDMVCTGTLIRTLDDPRSLILHKPGEGEKPIFDRKDIIVNLDFEDRVVITTEPLRSSRSKEREKSRNRSRSRSRRKSFKKEYYSSSRSKSNDSIDRPQSSCVEENSRDKSDSSFHRTENEQSNKTDKNDTNTSDDEANTSSGVKSRRRTPSKERQRSSSRTRSKLRRRKSPRSGSYRNRDRESERTRRSVSHSRFNSRDTSHKRRSTSPMRNRESRSRNRSPYSKPQGRRSRSPYRDRDSNYRGYRDRSKSPYYRESYNSLAHREYRHRRSPPNINPPMNHRIPIPPYQMPPNFGPLWPLYEHVPSLGYMMSENYLAGPPPRIPGNLIGRPRLPPLKLPVYNNRTIPTFKKSDSDVPASTANTSSTANTATTANIPTTSSAPSSTITTNVTGNTTEEVG